MNRKLLQSSISAVYAIRDIFKRSIIFLLSKMGIFPTRLTRKDALLDLMRDLRPVAVPEGLVRLGPKGDGGYLVPDQLAGITACISPGVSDLSGFEKDCAERGMQVFLADYTVDAPREAHPNFHFLKKHLGSYEASQLISVNKWVLSASPDSESELLLQMDIEGSEYEVIHSMSETVINRFRIMIVEFHDLEKLWSKPFFQFAEPAFRKILKTHQCVHIHPNNSAAPLDIFGLSIPPLMEFTFLRKDRILSSSPQTEFPHPLDQDNADAKPVDLPKCWYLCDCETRNSGQLRSAAEYQCGD